MKNILFASSECVPFIKTGGLADVVGSLPKDFDKEKYDVRVVIPKYMCMKQEWKEKLEYITVDFVRRIPVDIFEKWYADQDVYRKVTHIPTAEELENDYICLQDAADLLGISREKLAKIARRERNRQNKGMSSLSDRVYPYKQSTGILFKGLLLSGKAG